MNISSTLFVNETSVEQSNNDHNHTLVLILTISIPILVCLTLIILLIICYRRQFTELCWKKFENTTRLQSFDSNLSSNRNHFSYSQKRRRLSHRQLFQPRTETIVYNQLSSPSTPIINNPFPSSRKGEINLAFDQCHIENEEQTRSKQQFTTLQDNFPSSVQTPVPTITSAFVQAIATHRLTLLTDTNKNSLETLTPANTNRPSEHSLAPIPHTNTSPNILLFSQRTQF